MHIYIDTRTNEPVLMVKSHLPLLRPLTSNRAPNPEGADLPPSPSLAWFWNHCLNTFSHAERTARAINMGYTHLQYSQEPTKEQAEVHAQQAAAETLLRQGVYVDSDFKHTCYIQATKVAKGEQPEETNQIAMLFGFPSKDQVLAYLRKYSHLLLKFKAVVDDPRMKYALGKHILKSNEFIELFKQVEQEKSAELKQNYDSGDMKQDSFKKDAKQIEEELRLLQDERLGQTPELQIVVTFSAVANDVASHTLAPVPATSNASNPVLSEVSNSAQAIPRLTLTASESV